MGEAGDAGDEKLRAFLPNNTPLPQRHPGREDEYGQFENSMGIDSSLFVFFFGGCLGVPSSMQQHQCRQYTVCSGHIRTAYLGNLKLEESQLWKTVPVSPRLHYRQVRGLTARGCPLQQKHRVPTGYPC